MQQLESLSVELITDSESSSMLVVNKQSRPVIVIVSVEGQWYLRRMVYWTTKREEKR